MTTSIHTGTVVALGQSQVWLDGIEYAYVEIERADGRIVRADRVVVLNEAGALLRLGAHGSFHFDKARRWDRPVVQLYGVRRSDGRWGYDREQVRTACATANLLRGLALCFVFVGFPMVLLALLQLLYCAGMARLRHDEFFALPANLAPEPLRI